MPHAGKVIKRMVIIMIMKNNFFSPFFLYILTRKSEDSVFYYLCVYIYIYIYYFDDFKYNLKILKCLNESKLICSGDLKKKVKKKQQLLKQPLIRERNDDP